jgi:hypothetical protein
VDDRPHQPGDVSNQSINGVLIRLLGGQNMIIWLILALDVAAGELAVAVRAHLRGAEVAGILASPITRLLVSPL